MISIDNNVWNVLNDAPTASTVKVFFFIATNQPQDGVHGLRITKEQLAVSLKLGKSITFQSIKWLKDNLFIQELKMLEESDFMVNPYIVMNNGDRDERIKEWNRRCNLDNARESRLRKERRRREAKKANQQ